MTKAQKLGGDATIPKRLLSKDQEAALGNLLNIHPDEIASIVPYKGVGFIQGHWAFIGCLFAAAYKAGYGLRIETECAKNTQDHGLKKWAVQAFHYDGSPTDVPDEVRCVDKDEDLALQVALALLDLTPKTGA